MKKVYIYKVIRKLARISNNNKLETCGNDFYHSAIKSELVDYFNAALESVDTNSNNFNGSKSSEVIWFFWWQGLNEAPSLVKNCYSSLKKHSKNHKIIILSKNNICRYAHIPAYIYDKVNKNKITLTAFSDIVRFNLLKNYGGLWVDSTILWFKDFPNSFFSNFYTAHGSANLTHKNVSLGRWTSYLIGGGKNNPVFCFMDNFYKLYYLKNEEPLDYFMVDYGLNYAYDNISPFKLYIDDVAINNNISIHKGAEIMNKPLNSVDNGFIFDGTNGLKLTYKGKISSNPETVYNQIKIKG